MSKRNLSKKWWVECLKNKEKLERWLVSLYNNEKDAEERFKQFANDFCSPGTNEHSLFMLMAEQEREHADLVEKVLKNRGLEVYIKSSKDGRYWRHTLPCALDMKTSAAVGAYAEGLSLMRMKEIIKDENTPTDIKEMFIAIEKDETFHAKELTKIATNYGMKNVRECHDKGLEELGILIRDSTKPYMPNSEPST